MSIYKNYNPEQLEELFSNFLINSWSFSKVSSFSTNEKGFEMRYLYGCASKSSASAVAGQAYHSALEHYFKNYNEEVRPDIIALEQIASNFIDTIPANNWKLMKTTPTVIDCVQTATKNANKAISNFFEFINVYTDEIKRIISVEQKGSSWVVVNGVDIPMPLSYIVDLKIETNDGKIVLIDHKSRKKFTDEKEIGYSIGKQAITYVIAEEAEHPEKIDEVWFIENKIPTNKDKSPQLVCFKTIMDKETRRLYEALLYEPLKRMISAVSDPDYVYLINDNDNMSNLSEVYDFWADTMIAEVEDFNIQEDKKPIIEKRLKKIRDADLATATPNALKHLKKYSKQFIPYDYNSKDMTNKDKITNVLRHFNINVQVEHEFGGFSSRTYLLQVSAGVPIQSIGKYRLDIANALNVSNVRVHKDLYIYKDQSYVAIETSIKSDEILKWDKSKLSDYKIPIGIDNFGNTIVWDIKNNSTSHSLICGQTGSGKSVCAESTIEYALEAGVKDIYIFDPKFEFLKYSNDKRVKVYCEIEDIEREVKALVDLMEDRIRKGTKSLILVVLDEFADAFKNARSGAKLKVYENVNIGFDKNGFPKLKREHSDTLKSLEENIGLLLQKGRTSGFRLCLATQRASAKIISGDFKVNIPVQICFRVPKETDSMVVIDEPGAEALNGRGDGLINSPEYNSVVRFQGFFKG